MNKQIVALLLIISLAGAAIYYVLTQKLQSIEDAELLFDGLSDSADSIERVEILNHHGSLLIATRSKDGWFTQVDAIGIDYPVDQEQLSALVTNLVEAKLFEAKTTKKENYARLGVSDIQSADSLATQINVYAKGKQYSVLVGQNASSGQGSYVRRDSEKQSWLIDTNITIPSSEFEWLLQPIMGIDKKSVVAISRLDNQPYTLIKDDAEQVSFTLKDLNEAESLKYDSIVDGFVDNIINLNFEEIVSMPENFWQASETDTDTVFIPFLVALANGDNISMTLATNKNVHLVRFVSSAASDQSYWDGLTYSISSYNSGQLDKSRESFVEAPIDLPDDPSNIQKVIKPSQAIDEGESPN